MVLVLLRKTVTMRLMKDVSSIGTLQFSPSPTKQQFRLNFNLFLGILIYFFKQLRNITRVAYSFFFFSYIGAQSKIDSNLS